EKDGQQPQRGGSNSDRMLGQDGKSPVDELNVHPIDQQKSLSELYQGAETPLACAPAAPRVGPGQNHQQQSDANQKKIRTAVPEVINRIDLPETPVQPACQVNQPHSARTGRREGCSFVIACPITQEKETDGESGECEGRPGKDGEKPGLRLAEIMHSV